MRPELVCLLACVAVGAGCGSQSVKPDAPTGAPGDGAPPGDVPGHMPGMPGLGAHGLSYYKLDHAPVAATLSTPAMTTQRSGSTIIVSIGRGDKTLLSLPTDSQGNKPYRQIDTAHEYHLYQDSGTALYAISSATGGAGFQVTTNAGLAVAGSNAGRADEITIAAVEVIEGSHIQDSSWYEDLDPPNTSGSVTTTGPATLIAFWWGDGFPHTPQSATPGDGFDKIDTNAFETDSFVQCAVAAKNVTAAGTYSVTWTSDPDQGAQLWLVAVQ
jgi:hypothetical protein